MTTTSIMLCTYNRLDLTKRMLDNFFRATTSPYHLIIVDDASSDNTAQFLGQLDVKGKSEYCLSFNYQINEKNMGIATSRNRGLKIADQYSDPYLATLDNDIELPNNWLQNCIDVISANPRFTIGVNLEGVNYPPMTQNGKTFQYKARGNLGSACMVFGKDLHDKIGYFTTEYQKYGEEDADWGFRTIMSGHSLGYLQEPGVHFGVGELDTGEYRKFKDECRAQNLTKFQNNCRAYMRKEKPIHVPYSEKQ